MEISELVGGRVIFAHPSPGRTERKLSFDFPFIGEFRARLLDGNGQPIAPEDYIFVNYPVFEADDQGVIYSKHSAVREIPAEHRVLPWTNDRNWYAEPQATLIVTDGGATHAQMSDGHTVMLTRDGGRVIRAVNTVLRDATTASLGGSGAASTKLGKPK